MDDNHKNYQTLRVKPFPNNEENCQILKDNLNSILGDTYLICKEWSSKTEWHCHAVFYAPDFNKLEFRDTLYEFLKSHDLFDEGKKGNATYTCTTARNLERATMYPCKDKDIIYDGNQMWKDFVEECKKNSFAKPQSIKELMDDLYSLFESGKINERELWIQMVFQRAQFPDQKTRYHDIDALVETFNIKKHGIEYVKEVWENRNLKL